jgi:hypothetical protein
VELAWRLRRSTERDGRLAVALRDRAAIAVVEPRAPEAPGSLATRCEVETAAEPVALAMTPDDHTLLVTSGWGHALGGYDATSLDQRFEAALDREPRAVVASDDGTTAFVTHAVGSKLSVIDLRSAAPSPFSSQRNPLWRIATRSARVRPASSRAPLRRHRHQHPARDVPQRSRNRHSKSGRRNQLDEASQRNLGLARSRGQFTDELVQRAFDHEAVQPRSDLVLVRW